MPNSMKPTSLTLQDLECHQTRIQKYLGSRVQQLQLQTYGGGLILRGLARTYHAKQLAQHAAQSMTRLAIVANQIEIVRARAVAGLSAAVESGGPLHCSTWESEVRLC